MTNLRLKIFFCLVAVALSADALRAQYYDNGQSPASTRWYKIKTGNNSFVFPRNYEKQARRVVDYMDTVSSHIGYGFPKGTMRMPVVMRTHNFASNGLVMMAPSYMELVVTPGTNSQAMPWLKQLAVHEYRHNVHYNNVNVGVPKFLSYFLGQTGSITGMAFLPIWALEGDAVMAETQMSSFGRALQPSFTIEYRALALEGQDKNYPIDKYFSGSFKDYMPDHYQLGYQLNAYAWTRYGENIWAKVAPYGARRPYMVFTSHFGMKKYYGTTPNKLFTDTFDDLNAFWRSLPLEDNSASIVETPITSYTTYTSPVYVGDEIYAIKTDLDKTSRIVRVAPDASEQTIYRTGQIHTGLTYAGDRLWWSELRQSTFWEQKRNSQICWYDLSTGRAGTVKGATQELFPVGMEQGYASVEYDYSGVYSIKYGEQKLTLPDSLSVHGLAFDPLTSAFYFIALSDNGMWIGSVDYDAESGDSSATGGNVGLYARGGAGVSKGSANGNTGDSSRLPVDGGESHSADGFLAQTFNVVTQPSYASINNLRAAGGKLYYNSIATGKDEAHCYDLASGSEYRITTSRYGSFAPSPASDGESVVLTTYTPDGYLLSTTSANEAGNPLPYSRIPANMVNPERVDWGVMNIDNYRSSGDTVRYESKKYRKGLHLFRFHSWAPVYFEPDNILSESEFNIHLGATLLSQNLLNSTFTTLGYRYTDNGNLFSTKINYFGWAPKFEIEAEVGDMDQLALRPAGSLPIKPTIGKIQKHFAMTARAYLPINISSGYHVRWLTPMVEFKHDNHKVYYSGSHSYRNGYQRMAFSLQFTDNVRMAYRDFLPRWGYAVRASMTSNPFNGAIGEVYSAYGRVYLPGIGSHHSLMLRGVLQKAEANVYPLRQKELFPRGADYDIYPASYQSASADYQLPLCYPDTGISSILYIRRIRLNLTGDYARYKSILPRGGTSKCWSDIYSYGAEVTFDIVPVRLPASTKTSITFKLHKANTSSSPKFGVSLVMPI